MKPEVLVNNNLNMYVERFRAERTLETGKKVLIGDLTKELANYCGVSEELIKRIKSNKAGASLPLALKLSDYFNCTVNDLFSLKEDNENTEAE